MIKKYALLVAASLCVAAFSGVAHAAPTDPDPAPAKANTASQFAEALALQKKEKYAEAAARYADIVKADPSYAEAHSNLGYCLRKQKKWDDAIASYTTALKLNPKLAPAHEYIGEAYVELAEKAYKAKDNTKVLEYKALAEKHLAALKELLPAAQEEYDDLKEEVDEMNDDLKKAGVI
ncbi:hypothetical protein DB346_23555 [Verrucomicrobia bacterium LW23]|nr:hypothetical protein DB346_23555 [Verrucomicrobia bacterium LW23]